MTLNGGLDAGLYQIFSCTGTGKVVLGQAQRIYPQWWGAKGDGINNDLSSLQACLNAAAAGSEVYFLPGSYLSSGNKLFLPATNNITLAGSGPGKTKLISNYTDYYGIQSGSSMDGLTIKDMTIQGPDSGTNVPAALLVFEYTYNDLAIQNVEFKIAKKSAILFDVPQAAAHRLRIERCWFHHINVSPYNGTAGFGTIYTPPGSDMVIQNNIFENINDTGSNLQHAIYGYGGDRVKILDNYFSGVSADPSAGNGGVLTLYDWEFRGNVCNGIAQIPFYDVSRLIVQGNQFIGSQVTFVRADNVQVNSNIFKGNYTGKTILNIITGCTNFEIIGNSVKSDLQRALYIAQDASVIVFQGNYCESVGGWDNAQIDTTGANINLIGNYFANSGNTNSIRVDGLASGSIVNNTFKLVSNSYYGVRSYLADPSVLLVRDNVYLLGAPAYGITSLPYKGTTTLSSGTKAITFPGALADATYQVNVTGGANETFYVTNKTTTGFTINSSNDSSTASVAYICNPDPVPLPLLLAYDFTFTYGNGDNYNGTVWTTINAGYYQGYTLSKIDEHGQTGTYTITKDYGEYSLALGDVDKVFVDRYWDAETGRGYDVSPHYPDAAGTNLLGSESGYIIMTDIPEFKFGKGTDGVFYEADVGSYSRYNFVYYYSSTASDYYYGYVYAPTSFQTSGPSIHYASYIYNQPLELWSSGYQSFNDGFYYILSITDCFASSYDKKSYITSYCDGNTAQASLGVNSDGSSTASSVYVADRTTTWESGYAVSGSSHAAFSPYLQANVSVAAGMAPGASLQAVWTAYWSRSASLLMEEK